MQVAGDEAEKRTAMAEEGLDEWSNCLLDHGRDTSGG